MDKHIYDTRHTRPFCDTFASLKKKRKKYVGWSPTTDKKNEDETVISIKHL